MLKLVCRFLDVNKGEILIDDEPIKNFDVNFLRSNISFATQDSFLFSDTILNNLLFGKSNANNSEISNLLDLVCINKDILKFKDGIETKIGERGVTLSGGQKQRLSLARALLKKSNILLIDDSLSNIDVENEKKIISNIYKLKNIKTTLIVSNRVSSITKCDKIIVLNNGEIIEQGNHEDLIKLNGYYKKLYDLQSMQF